MSNKQLGKNIKSNTKEKSRQEHLPRPSWVSKEGTEEDLCPECFKVVGVESRYKLVCMLGKKSEGMSVGDLTYNLKLKQPTVTHHLQILHSVGAVHSNKEGRNKIYKLNRKAHCFEECRIPY